MQNKCVKCGYEWPCTSKLSMVNCPSCRKPTPNQVLEIRSIKKQVAIK